jgi:hypothetical protein
MDSVDSVRARLRGVAVDGSGGGGGRERPGVEGLDGDCGASGLFALAVPSATSRLRTLPRLMLLQLEPSRWHRPAAPPLTAPGPSPPPRDVVLPSLSVATLSPTFFGGLKKNASAPERRRGRPGGSPATPQFSFSLRDGVVATSLEGSGALAEAATSMINGPQMVSTQRKAPKKRSCHQTDFQNSFFNRANNPA